MPVYTLSESTAKSESYFLPAEKLITGNPKQTLWLQYNDVSDCFCAGVWHSDIGKWHISYTEEEYCHILEGTSIISETHGETITVAQGDSFVIPRGFEGTWEVVIPTKKTFVIYEPKRS